MSHLEKIKKNIFFYFSCCIKDMSIPTEQELRFEEIHDILCELKAHIDYLENRIIEIERINFVKTDFSNYYDKGITANQEKIKKSTSNINVPCDIICEKSYDFDEKDNHSVSCSNGLPCKKPTLLRNKKIICQIINGD